METQLTLLEARPNWRLDERTRNLGRQRVAEARAALRAAGDRSQRDQEPTTHAERNRPAA